MRITRNIITATLCLLGMTSLASCDLETSDNGKLDGYWHLERVDTLETGGVLDLKKEKRFWAVQKDLLEMDDYSGDAWTVIMRFKQSGKTLVLSDPHRGYRTSQDPVINDVKRLQPYGVNNFEETFNIDRISGGKMVLSSEMLRLTFVNF